MLIDGVILEEGPMNPPHAITLELVEETIRTAFGTGWRIRNQSPLVLGQDLDPEPDLAVIAGTARGSSGHPTTAELVVEVADSSFNFDTNEKRLLYARTGIREYWVVDVNGRRLLVYRDPQSGDYTTSTGVRPGRCRCSAGGNNDGAGGRSAHVMPTRNLCYLQPFLLLLPTSNNYSKYIPPCVRLVS